MATVHLSQCPNAGFFKRVSALVYDLFLVFAVGFLYSALVMAIATAFGLEPDHLSLHEDGDTLIMQSDQAYQPALRGPLFQLGLIASVVAFYIGFWTRRGATLGMQTWRLKLIDANGHYPNFKICALRCVLGLLGLVLVGVSYWWILIDSERRSLHDRLTATRVIVTPKSKR